jgi:hypothetical protein
MLGRDFLSKAIEFKVIHLYDIMDGQRRHVPIGKVLGESQDLAHEFGRNLTGEKKTLFGFCLAGGLTRHLFGLDNGAMETLDNEQ